MVKTTITVTQEVWKALNSMKRVGDSMDDVLRRVLGIETANKDDNENLN